MVLSSESFLTNVAFEWSFICVSSFVDHKIVALCEFTLAESENKGLFLHLIGRVITCKYAASLALFFSLLLSYLLLQTRPIYENRTSLRSSLSDLLKTWKRTSSGLPLLGCSSLNEVFGGYDWEYSADIEVSVSGWGRHWAGFVADAGSYFALEEMFKRYVGNIW